MKLFPIIASLDLAFSLFAVIILITLVIGSRFSEFAVIRQISMTMMGLTPVPLIRALFPCVFTIPLYVLVAWGLNFLYQQELTQI